MEGGIRRSSGVDDEDPFPIRSRSRSPSRLAAPAMQDRESLLAVYTCTGGGSWRTSLGWPNFGGISRQASLGRRSIVSPPTAKPSASQNPFREGVIFSDGDGEHRAKASAPKYVGVDCPTPPRSDGCGSPGNPFARAEVEAAPKPKSKNPFAPETPTTTASSHEVTAAHVLQTPPPLTSPEKRRSSPLDAAADLGGLRSRRRSPSPTADISGRSAFLGSPGQRKSLEAGAGAAWFGVSLGPAARVTELKLVDNGLIGTLPSALGGLEMLRYLHLGRNALSGTIPTGISSLVNLEWLNLSENFLTGPVPATLSSHTRLVELNLSANRLSGPFPQELCGLARLVSLQLSHNDLEGFLPVEMCKLCELVTLCLDHNRFCGPIPLGVSAMKGLKELRLDNNELTGRIPLGVGKMKSLQVLSLSNNLLRGSMPEGLISKLGATKVQKFIMPGNRLADVDTAMLLLRRPLQCTADRGLLVFSLVAAYVDLGSDVGAAVTFYLGSDVLSFILAIIFIVVPTSVMVATTMGAARGRDRNKKILLTVFQLRLVWEARDGLAKRRETRDYKTAKFVEACFEAAPQMLLQTVALASLWNENQAKTSDVFVAFSIINSVFSVSWETMSALDRGWAEEMVEERARRGTSWPCGASAHRWLVLLCLWVFHVCEVGLRGLSLALLALALQGWAVLVMLGVWGVRIAVARATEASDLKWTKVLIKALAACLLDSIWDSRPAYIIASICTLMESSMFFVVAAKELRGADDDSPLGEAVSDAAWTAGSVYAVRCALDVWLRAPLHWGGVYGGGLSACSWWGSASARLRGALGTAPSEIGRAEPMPLPSAILSTPMATPAPVPNGRQ